MSDPRLLSAEQLERALWDVEDDKSEREIRLHVAALTEQLATLRAEAAKLGHEPGCASNICAKCLGSACGEFGCELAETVCPDYKPKPCNCAQSRIQGVKHEK